MVKRKMVVGEVLERAVRDWSTLAPRSKRFLTGEGHERSDLLNSLAFPCELKQQCEEAGETFMRQLQASFLKYKPTWMCFPKLMSCLLDPELAPHFAHKVPTWPLDPPFPFTSELVCGLLVVSGGLPPQLG